MSGYDLGIVNSVWMKAASGVPFVGEFFHLYEILSFIVKIDDSALCAMDKTDAIHHIYEVKHYDMIGVARSLIESVACVVLVALGFLSPLFGIILSVLCLVIAGSLLKDAYEDQFRISVLQEELSQGG